MKNTAKNPMTKINHYFSLLVDQFLPTPPKIKIVFKDYLGEKENPSLTATSSNTVMIFSSLN
jgi:hypothetical protein